MHFEVILRLSVSFMKFLCSIATFQHHHFAWISVDHWQHYCVWVTSCFSVQQVVQATMVRDRQHGPVIELNRIQVKRSRSKGGLAGPDGMKSVFGQMVSKMSLLTQEALFLPHRVWKVKFVGKKYVGDLVEFCKMDSVSCLKYMAVYGTFIESSFLYF